MYHLRGATFWHHSSPTTLPFVRLCLLSSSICLRWVAKCWFRVYIRNRWYFELINYGNISPNLHGFKLNYSIISVGSVYIYIYVFLHFQWYILFDEEWISKISTISYQYIHQRRKHHWYHWFVGISYLLVSCIYIEVFCILHGLLYPTKNEFLTFQVQKSIGFSQRVAGGRCWRYGFGRIPKYNVICIYIWRIFLFKRSSKINR